MNNQFINSLDMLRAKGRLRELKSLSGRNGCRVVYLGREMLNLSSNDYLGLAGDIELHKKFYRPLGDENLLEQFGLGATSSRLLSGDTAHAHLLEETLTTRYNKESCLLYNSGYHANIGVLPSILGKNDLILADKLNHASIVDGMRLSRAKYKRYRHCNYAHLGELLAKYRRDFREVVVVTESVFSMDGDVVDLAKLVTLKKEFNCKLYLDEAHAIGLYGSQGLGIAEKQMQLDDIDFLVGTFGKALASVGAFVLCTALARDFLINFSRSLIFTTALPPVVLSWNNFIFWEMLSYNKKRKKLQLLSANLRQKLTDNNLKTKGETNIVPVLLGDDSLAVSCAEAMQKRGYLIFPIRPPTVSEGTARLRLSLTADMEEAEIEEMVDVISTIYKIFR